jgi:hypothetical protein
VDEYVPGQMHHNRRCQGVPSGSSASCIGAVLVIWSLLSWNVAGRLKRWPDQFAAVSQINPDVIALQEVTVRSSHMWRQALTDSGWGSFVFSFDLAPADFVAAGPRRYGWSWPRAFRSSQTSRTDSPGPGVSQDLCKA